MQTRASGKVRLRSSIDEISREISRSLQWVRGCSVVREGMMPWIILLNRVVEFALST